LERIEPIDLAEDEPLLPASQEREEKREKRNSLALNVNFGVNIILLLAKGLAVLSSSSVSLVASFVDAFLDFISTLIIFVSNVAMGHKGDRHKYPAGKKRFEPLGVLIFSVTMIASFVQVSQQAARSPFAVLLNMTVCTGLYRVIPEGVGRAKRRRRGGRTQLVWYRVSRSFVFWYRPWLT
jgi:divalent metal cation (Fe/Co/Zn/Cd) transporter